MDLNLKFYPFVNMGKERVSHMIVGPLARERV